MGLKQKGEIGDESAEFCDVVHMGVGHLEILDEKQEVNVVSGK